MNKRFWSISTKSNIFFSFPQTADQRRWMLCARIPAPPSVVCYETILKILRIILITYQATIAMAQTARMPRISLTGKHQLI